MTGKNYDLLYDLKEDADYNMDVLWPKLTKIQNEITTLEEKLQKKEENIKNNNKFKEKYSKFLNFYTLFVIIPLGALAIIHNLLDIYLLSKIVNIAIKVSIIPSILVFCGELGNFVDTKLNILQVKNIKKTLYKKEKKRGLLVSRYKKENRDSLNSTSILNDYDNKNLSSFKDGFFTDIDFSKLTDEEFSRVLAQISICSSLMDKENLNEEELYNLKMELILLSNLLKSSHVDSEICSKLVQTDKILSRKLENKRI